MSSPLADAAVLLDGIQIGSTGGARTVWLEPGQHVLLARSGDRSSLTRTITLSRGHDEDVRLDVPAAEPILATATQPASMPVAATVPRKRPAHAEDNTARNVALITGSALTVGGIVVGVVSTLHRSSELDARDATFWELRAEVPRSYGDDSLCVPRPDIPAKCAELRQHIADADAAQNLATGSFITAGVFGAATVATYIFWPRAAERPGYASLVVAPLVIPGSRGAQVRWVF